MTAKQRAARAKFKAVVKEATKLRKKNPKLTQAEAVKQAWAISYSTKKISGSNYSGRSVEIRPASASSKKFIVWDTKTNQIFANEKFDNYSEAVDFVKQNKLVLRDKKIGYSKEREKLHKNATAWLKKRKKIDADKSKKDRVSLAYQQAPFGKPGVGAIKKKAATKVKGKKSKRTSEMHTDTKSHNVNIRVVSGIGEISDMIIHTLKLYDNKREYHEKQYKFWVNNAKQYPKDKKQSLKYARTNKNLVTYYTKQIAKLRLKIK